MEDELAGFIHVITGRPSDDKGKNKCVAEDVLSEFFQNELLVVTIHLNRYEVRRVLVDTGSSVNLLPLDVFNKLGLDKNNLVKVFYLLMELGDKTVVVLDTINLPLVLGDEKHKQELYAKFAVVDISLAYNVILGRPVLNSHGIVINMDAIRLKLLSPGGLAVVRGKQKST
ncbi:hypothetical protein MANES_18G141017v8 [Manihot esculenta]|uniref:Uncharacterized protein n=1 Tax=Manihot esculenta TaxID=3983 RepID=A0ACB7G0S5_MANES|nr:hypothetical protein MANES_18G141017v8 [Manihot esculenta]